MGIIRVAAVMASCRPQMASAALLRFMRQTMAQNGDAVLLPAIAKPAILPLGELHQRLVDAAREFRPEYVAIFDDDDYYHPNHLLHAVDMLDANGALAVGFNRIRYIDHENRSAWRYQGDPWYAVNSGLVIRAEVFDKVRFTSSGKRGVFDVDWYYRLAERWPVRHEVTGAVWRHIEDHGWNPTSDPARILVRSDDPGIICEAHAASTGGSRRTRDVAIESLDYGAVAKECEAWS